MLLSYSDFLPRLSKLGLFLAVLFFVSAAQATTPRVVVSLKPLQSLVANIMQGVAQPTVLLEDGASPHTFQLKPSTFKLLQQADLVIWVGPELEGFMSKSLTSIHPKFGTITLMNLADIRLLPQRIDRQWQENDSHEHHHDAGTQADPHIWLSIYNAEVIVNAITQNLSIADPSHATQYQANATLLKQKLDVLKKVIVQELASVHHQPYLVYHDGYQYFEKEFDLPAQGTLLLNPHLPLSAYALHAVQKQIQQQKVICVFGETEFNEALIRKNLQNLPVRIGELDPLGVHQTLGPDNYEKTLLQLAQSFKTCLQN